MAKTNASDNDKKETSTTTATTAAPQEQAKKEGDTNKKETATKQSSNVSLLSPQPMSKKETTTATTTSTTATSSTANAASPSVHWEREELDDCCICLDKLSRDSQKNARALCCGKEWHVKCHHNVQKSKMPDHLKHRCHHCRKPNPKTNEECVKQLREWLDKDKPWAQSMMAQWY